MGELEEEAFRLEFVEDELFFEEPVFLEAVDPELFFEAVFLEVADP